MTITYQVNGTEIHGVQSRWERIRKSGDTDGLPSFGNYATNRWFISQMAMADFTALRGAQGDAVTLDTNDIDDRNSGASYATAFVGPVSLSEHTGLRAVGIMAEFRVKVA